MNTLKAIFAATLFLLSGCATQNFNKNRQAWTDLRNTEAYEKEKAIYKERNHGRDFCWGIGLEDFLTPHAPTPIDKCLYPASKMIVSHDDGLIVRNQALKQGYNRLKVLQATPAGFVIQSRDYRNDRVIFIQRTEETNIVDGAFLDDSQDWKVYEYLGPYTYQTLAGPKTVHSFRKVTRDHLTQAAKNLKLYEPKRDLLIELRLWDYLGDPPQIQ